MSGFSQLADALKSALKEPQNRGTVDEFKKDSKERKQEDAKDSGHKNGKKSSNV